jgi:hypothetical protein
MSNWKYSKVLRVAVTAAIASTLVAGGALAGDLEGAARRHVASQNGVGADALQLGAAEEGYLPLTGARFTIFKFYTADGAVYGATVDAASGMPVEHADLVANEAQARLRKYGAIEPALYERMAANPSARLPVAVWTRQEAMSQLGRGGGGRSPDLVALQAVTGDAVSPAADFARNLGAIVTTADLAPVFFADLNADQIRALARRVDVVAIQEVPKNLMRLNDDSATSDRFVNIWTSADGGGARIAVHEDDGVFLNQFLHSGPRPVTYWNPGTPNVGSHATNVAGVIASTHNWRRGGAFGISEILSANFQSFANAQNIVNSAGWAIRSGADAINMSWGGGSGGGQTFFTAWVDHLVKNFGVPIVISSGNDTNFVLSPSLGWNTISVGSYFDNNTGGQSDDAISVFSSYKNPLDPVSGARYEKPDLMAMGGQVIGGVCQGTDTTGLNNLATDSTCGTSFSAPDVSAVVALAVAEEPALRAKAEAIKAVVMAGATHNIVDGASIGDCPTSPTPGDCRDGAGAINAYQTIKNVVTPGNWKFQYLTPASFPGGFIEYPVTISKNKNVRFVLAWDSTATCGNLGTATQGCSSDVLNADLDLALYNPSGALVKYSGYVAGSAEVVDFKTLVTGVYKIRIVRWRFDANTDTYAGLAWNLSTSDTLTAATGVTSLTLGVAKAAQTTDKGRSYWDSYAMAPGVPDPTGCVGFMNASRGLEKLYKVTTVANGKITATLSAIGSVHPTISNDVDVAILRKTGSADLQNGQMLACGNTTAAASGQAPGTYYIVVDGFNGAVANYTLTASFAAGLSADAPQEALPVREVLPETIAVE